LLFPAAMVLLSPAMQAIENRVLSGHRPAAVAHLTPLGPLPKTNHLHLAIGLPLRRPAELATFLQQLSDPASPKFRRYLTPAQFTARFGPSAADYQAAIDFATAHGLEITGTHPNRLLLDVAGSVAQVERAFQVRLQLYPHPDEDRVFYSVDTEPSLDPRVRALHISGLDNFTLPRPLFQRVPTPDRPRGASPRGGSGPGATYFGRDFRAAYVPGTSLTGTGQAVGLFELDGYYLSDILAYEKAAGLPNVPLVNVLIDGFDGIPRPGGTGNEEAALDIEMVISMAPGLSQVLVYEGSPTASTAVINDVLNRMATDNLASQLSCSWGFPIDATTSQIFQQYAAQGQSFFLASGDNGASGGPVMQPPDHPCITVVGGTTLTTSGLQAWVSETTWKGSGGGISTVWPIPDWQRGISMTVNQGSTTMRNFPDVALIADNVWVMADNGQKFAAAGTSIGAPLWAALTALVNQQGASEGKPPVGFLNPALYAIGKSAGYAQCFHDIKTGANLSSSSPSRFFARAGYDLCTGWGTPNGVNLINALLAPPLNPLQITSPLGFTAIGPPGGPAVPASQIYMLTNTGTIPLTWGLGSSADWLRASLAGGTLIPGGPAAFVMVSLGDPVTNLLVGTFTATLSFTNLTDLMQSKQTREFTLLLGNGGFEAGDFTHWSLLGNPTVNLATSIDAAQWYGSSTAPGIDDSEFVHSGLYGALLGQSNYVAYLLQTVPTVPGQLYLLSFWHRNPAAGTPNAFSATWDGNTLFDQADLGAFAWTNRHFVVSASGTSSVLEFGSRNDPYAFGLDDVALQAIPAPLFQNSALTNGMLTLTWQALAGAHYQVQFTADLISPDWQNLGPPIQANATTATATTSVSWPQQFYRLQVTP
jgi:hypothetical protein